MSGPNGEPAVRVTSEGFLDPSLSPSDGHPFVRGPEHAEGSCSLCRFVRSRHLSEAAPTRREQAAARLTETDIDGILDV